jgi:pimeloyl-ACP methyl ester carboxylesterase/DNA-binding CsgD family transcriptional regulator
MDAPPVQYVKTSDGYSIAYAVQGEGMPLVVAPAGFSHVQLNWKNRFFFPTRPSMFEVLADRFRLVTFDCRGQGMSQRGIAPGEIAMSQFVMDLEAVVGALQLKRFVLLGCAIGGHIAVQYARAHPQSVAALVLNGVPASMTAWPSGLFSILSAQNWEYFLRSILAPGLSAEDTRLGIELMKETTTYSDYEAMWAVQSASDVSDVLPQLDVPSLVIQAREFNVLPLTEIQRLAALIPGARMVTVDGQGSFGDVDQAMRAIETFLANLPAEREAGWSPLNSGLSQREVEVLRLLAWGRSNQQIADELVISVNTVIRHVSNVFGKTGVANRAQAAIYARDHGIA